MKTDFEPEDTYISQNGYVQWKIGGRWQAAHRFVMEGKLKRRLLPGERVRFVDGDKTNIDADNLEISTATDSKQERIAYLHQVIEGAQNELEGLQRGDS